ncbi:MAG: hypothetical protein OEU54_12870 [Gemmatimonadota bacterium]|nr:hypothetical protein [Gemmatimonadota bacterium]
MVVLWWSRAVAIRAIPYDLPDVETTPAPEGLVVVEVAPTELAAAVDDPRPEPADPQTAPEPRELEVIAIEETDIPGAPGDPSVDDPVAAGEAPSDPGMTNAERLTPRFVDGRIWFDPRNPFLYGERLARFARADSAVRAILRDWLDSLRLDDEARRRAMDWTFEKDGKRWGISPEGLHLGDITIPIPFGFAPSGPHRREFEQAIRDLTEIQLQDLRSDIEAVADERRRAMRERSEEEARRRAGDTTGVRRPPFGNSRARGPPPSPP